MAEDAIAEPVLHKIEGIVTPDNFELGVHRMRVPQGWLYWWQPMGGTFVSDFVWDNAGGAVAGELLQFEPAQTEALASAAEVSALQARVKQLEELLAKVSAVQQDAPPAAPVTPPAAEPDAPAAAKGKQPKAE